MHLLTMWVRLCDMDCAYIRYAQVRPPHDKWIESRHLVSPQCLCKYVLNIKTVQFIQEILELCSPSLLRTPWMRNIRYLFQVPVLSVHCFFLCLVPYSNNLVLFNSNLLADLLSYGPLDELLFINPIKLELNGSLIFFIQLVHSL